MDLERRLKDGLAHLNLKLELPVQGRLLDFLAELKRWNRSINLTAIDDPLVALEKHLLDSLTLLPLLSNSERILDFGSGAGLPGIPLKIARPELDVWSVDAVRKKINFQKHIVRHLGLTGFHPWHGRVENFIADLATPIDFSLITARAVADLGKLAELASPLLSVGGRLIAMKGPEGQREVEVSLETLERCGLELVETRCLMLPVSRSDRQLLVLKKVV
jgi:16S rRNA (guanine527-N7)-methyltransferase